MLRFLACAFLLATLNAAVLPEKFGPFSRGPVSAPELPDRPIWNEFGLKASERARYTDSARAITVTAYRMLDPTGAYAARKWLGDDPKLQQEANYLLEISPEISADERKLLVERLEGVERSSLPTLERYLPKQNRVEKSVRYILGPLALASTMLGVPGSTAAFERGAEASVARYRVKGEDITLGVFAYPTPQMAIERSREFEKLPELAVRRIGPMVVAASPKSSAAAELASRIQYETRLTWSEPVSKDTPQDAARMILAILLLAAVLILASVLLGFVFGGYRILAGRFGISVADNSLTTLNLGGK